MRWRHRSTTGTTPGTSRSRRVRRPRPTATTPQTGQPISCHGVETVMVMPVGSRSTRSTWTPSRPSNRSQRRQGSVVGAQARPVALDNVEVLDQIGMLGRSGSSGDLDPATPHPAYRSATTPTGCPKSPTAAESWNQASSSSSWDRARRPRHRDLTRMRPKVPSPRVVRGRTVEERKSMIHLMRLGRSSLVGGAGVWVLGRFLWSPARGVTVRADWGGAGR